jgi:enamine deaminase RidA (YjgF/YER057c/UK114 family)
MRNQLDNFEEAGLTFADVVAANVYLDSVDDFAKMNAIYTQYFTGPVKPARTTVQAGRARQTRSDDKGSYPTLEQVSFVAVRTAVHSSCSTERSNTVPTTRTRRPRLSERRQYEHELRAVALAWIPRPRQGTAGTRLCQFRRRGWLTRIPSAASARRSAADEAIEIREEDVQLPADARDVGRDRRRRVHPHLLIWQRLDHVGRCGGRRKAGDIGASGHHSHASGHVRTQRVARSSSPSTRTSGRISVDPRNAASVRGVTIWISGAPAATG